VSLVVDAPRKIPAHILPSRAPHPGWWGEGELKFFIDDD